MRLIPLNNVFRIAHGNKLDLNKMTVVRQSPQAVAFVGRSGERNGIVGFVRPERNVSPFPLGCLTVALGGAALSTFIQPRPFYTAQNIDVLEPLADMSLDVKLYYALCIEANRFRYSTFGREANRTLRTLLIPDPSTVPAWVDGAAARASASLVADLQNTLLT